MKVIDNPDPTYKCYGIPLDSCEQIPAEFVKLSSVIVGYCEPCAAKMEKASPYFWKMLERISKEEAITTSILEQ